MKNTKKLMAGVMALAMVSSLAACGSKSGDSENGGNGGNEENAAVETTTQATVPVNTEELKDEEVEVLDDVMSQLEDVELANKEVKWLAHYDLNPDTSGKSKSVSLEMFERKYGGSIKYYPCTWENRYDMLSTQVLGGEGIDIFPGGDTGNLPKGVISGMFQSVDDYVDLNDVLWQRTAKAMDIMKFGTKHFEFVTDVAPEEICIYSKATLEEYGLDDPWELYEAGNWNWDTFKDMLLEFVDPDADRYGLDGWYYEKSLFESTGVPMVGTDANGNLVCNINDPMIEKVQNYAWDLYQSGLMLDLSQFNWSIQPQFMGEGKELFLLWGQWGITGDPSTWSCQIEPENIGFVPIPSPEGSDPYQIVQLDGYMLCKGSANPEGAKAYVECVLLSTLDEGAKEISKRKLMDDSQWNEEMCDRYDQICELALKYPVYDLTDGTSTDIMSLATANAESAMRAPFHGITDWATTREMYADTLVMLVDEVNTNLQAAIG